LITLHTPDTTRCLWADFGQILQRLNSATDDWAAAGDPYDGPVYEARESVYADLREWNDRAAGIGVTTLNDQTEERVICESTQLVSDLETHLTIFPVGMPATNCPTWCLVDHQADWDAEIIRVDVPYSILKLDGTRVHGVNTLDRIMRRWQPFCSRPLFDWGYGNGRLVTLDLQAGDDGKPELFLEGGSCLTAENALSLASALVEAARTLTEATR
jgi:hypothetical protein